MNKFFLSLLLLSVIIISGCSIPGLPDFGSGAKGQFENDIVIIKDQSVFPDTAKVGQKISLVSYIQNLGEKNPAGFTVSIDLYDTCGVFSAIKAKCPKDADTPSQTACAQMALLPKEIKEISWDLTPDPEKVKVNIPSCKLKVAVSYPYSTSTQSELYFINSQEARLQQEQKGGVSQKSSSWQKGNGPVAAYLIPDSNVRQPIPGNSVGEGQYVPTSLYVENLGSGFLQKNLIERDSLAVKVDDNLPSIKKDNGCPPNSVTEIKLIGKKSPPQGCQLKIPDDTDISREKTSRISVDLRDYTYEFRKESSVSIETGITEAKK